MRDVGVEIWRDIPGYSRYQVSSFGRVRSLPMADTITDIRRRDGQFHVEVWHRKGKLLSPLICGCKGAGFYQVRLYQNRQRKSVGVATLVVWVFTHSDIDTYDEFKRRYKVVFIDKNPRNVALSNLMSVSKPSTCQANRYIL